MSAQESLYQDAIDKYGTALQRVARACEADPDKRKDLLHVFLLWSLSRLASWIFALLKVTK